MKSKLHFFLPYLIVLLPLTGLLKSNPGEVFLFDFLLIFLVISSLIFIFQLILCRFIKDSEKSSIFLTILFSGLFFATELSSTSPIFVWLSCLFLALMSLLIQMNDRIKTILSFWLFLPLTMVVSYHLISVSMVKFQIEKEIAEFKPILPPKSHSTKFEGNVYLIILDEFISEKAFNDYYHFDNRDFFNHLRSNEFKIISHSTSNYPWTIPSVSSIVNFGYHAYPLSKNAFTGLAHTLIEKNSLFKIFQNEGYEINHIPSIYWLGNPVKGVLSDFIFRTKSYGFFQCIAQLTPWKKRYRSYQRECHREHTLYQLQELELISKKPGKQMAFAHIMCPHRPIVFDREGISLSGNDISLSEKDANHRYYLDQAKFISGRVENVVDQILLNSSIPPLIILLSDHGKFPIGTVSKGRDTIPLKELSWRFSNLQALYLPDFNDIVVDNSTPINTVRLILSTYFGYDLPLVENDCCIHFLDYQKRVPNEEILKNL